MWVCAACSTRYAEGLPRCPHCSSPEHVEEGSHGSRLPYLDVACGNPQCRAFGVLRRVYLRRAAPGVVEMPLLGCLPCGMAMGLLATWMPETEETEDMPKITRHGGPSNAAELPVQTAVPGEQLPEVAESAYPPGAQPLYESGEGEQPSVGNNSSTSPETPPNSDEPSSAPRPPRVRTTGSRSNKGRAAGSTARSTAGPGEGDQPADTGDA